MTTTKHFEFETMATGIVEKDFLNQIVLLSEEVSIFRTGFGNFILSIKADFDDNCETENIDPSDVIHNFRKQITKVKEYSRKPTPQNQWEGNWEIINKQKK